jgi:aminoglycoside phosphotransferase (APT) family kinase protein
MAPSFDDPTYESDFVRTLLQEQLPQLAAADITHLARGWGCDVFRLGDEHVVRMARNLEATHGLQRESTLLPRLAAQLPLPIPEPLQLGVIDSARGLCFGLYRWLPGVAVCALDLTTSDYREIAPAMGEFLRALHGADSRPLPDDELARFQPRQRSDAAHAALDQLSWEGGLRRAQCQRLKDALQEAEGHVLSATRVVVHADLQPCNLLVNEDGFAGVIDWIDAHRGHPAADLAVAYLSFPSAARDALFASYGPLDASTRSWARWRAITVLAAAALGAQARDDSAMVRRCVHQLGALGDG